MLGFTSLPWDVIALVAELLENREIVRCWRVSKQWNKVFRSDVVCSPALRTILEPNCPNYAAHMALADQMVYHERRLNRFRTSFPWGKTAVHLGYDFCSKGGKIDFIDKNYLVYFDGRLAWFEWTRSPAPGGGLGEWICFVRVHSLMEGEILCRPIESTSRDKILCLSAHVAAVLIQDDEDRCLAWDLANGEERFLQLPFRTERFLIAHEWLVAFKSYEDSGQTMLFWNVRADKHYILRLDIPLTNEDVGTYFVPDGSAIIFYEYTSCKIFLEPDEDCLCENHESYEAIAYFSCAKFSVKDGSLLSSQTIENVQSVKTYNAWPTKHTTPSNRDGLLSLGSTETKKDGNHNSFTTIICHYDAKNDHLFLEKHEAPPFPFKVKPRYSIRRNCTRWKDVALNQIIVEGRDCWLYWTKVEQSHGDAAGRWIAPHDGYDGEIIWADDIHTVVWKKNVVHVHWYDKLAYLKARDNIKRRHEEKKKARRREKALSVGPFVKAAERAHAPSSV